MPAITDGGVLNEVAAERDRQDAKWGEQNHDLPVWITVLAEEIGEAAQEVLAARAGERPAMLRCRAELVQVAAVAVAAIEYIDRSTTRRCDAPSCPHCAEARDA